MTTRKILPIEDIHGSFSSNASFTLVRGEGFEVWQKVTSGMFDVQSCQPNMKIEMSGGPIHHPSIILLLYHHNIKHMDYCTFKHLLLNA